MRQLTFSAILAALMALAWGAASLTGTNDEIIRYAGMIPARLSGIMAVGGSMIPAWLTPITATFVHAGMFHLLFNALILLYCGQRVEAAVGGKWLALLLIAGAYGSAIAELLWSPTAQIPVIGASGATSALIAMYAMLFSEQKVTARGPIPGYVLRALWLLAAWVGLQVLIAIAFGGQVATLGHVGGFVVGLLLSRPILNRRFARSRL